MFLRSFFEPKNPIKNLEDRVVLSDDGQYYIVKGRDKLINVNSVKIVSISGRDIDAKDYADRH